MKKISKYTKKDIAVVIPTHKLNFNEEEKISMLKLKNKLKEYSVFFAIPRKLKDIENREFKEFRKVIFENKFFETYKEYNNLLKNKIFYEKFKEFKYILIYQTDCLVFKDNLLDFCNKDYDYIGSPWFILNKKEKHKFIGVGNGGLSLRKVSSFIEITKKSKKLKTKLKIFLRNFFPSIKVLIYKLFISRDYPKYHLLCVNEDLFWSYIAKQIKPNFKIADYQNALKFSFEKYPSFCLKENKNELPFGCHAWQKHDRNFWEKFI